MAAWYSLADLLLSRLDAENAHGLAIAALRSGLVPADRNPDPPSLAVEVWGRRLSNPIGLAAGFDKNAEVPDAALAMGFGFVEIGTVTPKPQPGNPRPRLFRLPEDRGVINRMGFNGGGLDAALPRLRDRPRKGFVGVNVGANKDSEDRAGDYAICAKALAPYADYLVCNVSSPNTPGLRNLQGRQQLADLLKRVQDAIAAKPVPLVVKIAPDATDDDLDDIVTVCRDLQMDGIIVGNTTLSRPASLISPRKSETGGLSGAPLTHLSTEVLRKTARRVEGQFPLIGCGGVTSGSDAYAKIRAGASLVQLYSALVYEGPPLVRRIKDELASALAHDGFKSVADATAAYTAALAVYTGHQSSVRTEMKAAQDSYLQLVKAHKNVKLAINFTYNCAVRAAVKTRNAAVEAATTDAAKATADTSFKAAIAAAKKAKADALAALPAMPDRPGPLHKMKASHPAKP